MYSGSGWWCDEFAHSGEDAGGTLPYRVCKVRERGAEVYWKEASQSDFAGFTYAGDGRIWGFGLSAGRTQIPGYSCDLFDGGQWPGDRSEGLSKGRPGFYR